MQKCDVCGKTAVFECRVCNAIHCPECATEAIHAGECHNGACSNGNPREGYRLIDSTKCHIEGCANLGLVSCFGCGMVVFV